MEETVSNSYQLLPPLERANYFKSLVSRGTPPAAIARMIHKSLSYVSNTLRLLKLPPLVQDGLAGGSISEGHARALLGLSDPETVITIYKEILVSNLNVRVVEAKVKRAALLEKSARVLASISGR